MIWRLQPAALQFAEQPYFVWPLISWFYVSNVIAVLVNLVFISLSISKLRMRFMVLAPMIVVLSVVGAYAAHQNIFDVGLMLLFGMGV